MGVLKGLSCSLSALGPGRGPGVPCLVKSSGSWLPQKSSKGRLERLSNRTGRSDVWLIRNFLFLMEAGS